MKNLKLISAVAALAGVLGTPSAANAYDRYDRCYRPRVGSTIVIGVPRPRAVYVQPRTYYAPAPRVVYREPAPVYYSHRNDTVVDVQRALARRGYYRGYIDGDIGPATRNAISNYQSDRGLRVTGTINEALLRSLNLL